jgi:hypothetical protein
MRESFDYDAFDRRSLSIVIRSKGKSFARLAREIEALRQKCEGVRDRAAKKYIRRNLDRRLLEFAIDTSQAHVFVDRLYNRNVRQGFNDLHAEVASAIAYGHYCKERGNRAKGLRALHKVEDKIGANKTIPRHFASNCLRAIKQAIRRVGENG